MKLLPGVFKAQKKDGTTFFRSSITYHSKHISLGSYDTELKAHEAYSEASQILNSDDILLPDDYWQKNFTTLPFKKWITLINYKNNNIYIKNPIYLYSNFFHYFLSKSDVLIFDADDLFYYSKHSIIRRGNHLFVSEYGMQSNISQRYGIRNFARPGVDFRFVNGDNHDFRYANIEVLNPYQGVTIEKKNGLAVYVAKIHINGNFLVGKYNSLEDAAIAYNKAVDTLFQKGVTKNFSKNYIENISSDEYISRYNNLNISDSILNFAPMRNA